MRLWGKVTSGLLLIMAAVFFAVAYGYPAARWEAVAAGTICVAVALFGVPVVVRLSSSFTGDEEVLANGLPYSATITALEPTRWRYNRYYPVVEFSLEVQGGGTAYQARIKQSVDPGLLARLAPGTVVNVRIDRKAPYKIVIDWGSVVRVLGEQSVTSERSLFRRLTARTGAATVGGILVVLSLFFAALAVEERRYEQRGVVVQGTAVGVATNGNWAYTFSVDGRIFKGDSNVLAGTASELKQGGPVAVQYLADAPRTSRIPGQRASYATWRNMALVAFVIGIALLLKARRLRRRGAQGGP